MKKFIGIVLIAITAGWNFSQSEKKMELSDLALANVEALARGEDQSGKICYYKGTTTYADYIPCTADYPILVMMVRVQMLTIPKTRDNVMIK